MRPMARALQQPVLESVLILSSMYGHKCVRDGLACHRIRLLERGKKQAHTVLDSTWDTTGRPAVRA